MPYRWYVVAMLWCISFSHEKAAIAAVFFVKNDSKRMRLSLEVS